MTAVDMIAKELHMKPKGLLGKSLNRKSDLAMNPIEDFGETEFSGNCCKIKKSLL